MEAKTPKTPTQVLGEQLGRWRKRQGLSAQGVADRLAEIGSNLDRRAISKIENGSRGVGIDEWLQISHVLGIPPGMMFLDLISGEPIAISPKLALHPWIIWEWVGGEHASPVASGEPAAPRYLISRVREWSDATDEVRMYRRDRLLSDELHHRESVMRQAGYAQDEERTTEAALAYLNTLKALASVYDEMVEHGMELPAKPEKWIKEMRNLQMSKYPDKLVIFDELARHREAIEQGGDGGWTQLRDEQGRQMFDERGYRINYGQEDGG